MKRPIIKDVEARKYVEHLESKLRDLNTDSIKCETYKSLRTFIHNNNKILMSAISEEEASNKDDKIMDRAFKYADNISKYVETLDKIYAGLGDKYVQEIDRESGSVYEMAMKSKK
jgi:hypothetical protein